MGTSDGPNHELIDAVLADWRQGDCVRGEQWFLFRIDPSAPLTPESQEAAAEGVDTAEAEVRGLMVATQTCDIVRSCADRPFVEVCPLVAVDEEELHQIERGRRPRYAVAPGVANDNLVADLDRVMTVEKGVVASWHRVAGCRTDAETRELARSLARKRVRFAFPDDFVVLVRKLQSRLQDKHGKESDEGRALRALREIRVSAAPSWSADAVSLTFWFLRGDEQPDFEGTGWDEHLKAWLKLVPTSGRFRPVEGLVATLGDLTARDYVGSDPLDLEHLSALSDE